jgi:hypothetical protein
MLGSFASGNWLLYGRVKQIKRSPRVEEILCREEIGVFNVESFPAAHTDTVHVEILSATNEEINHLVPIQWDIGVVPFHPRKGHAYAGGLSLMHHLMLNLVSRKIFTISKLHPNIRTLTR